MLTTEQIAQKTEWTIADYNLLPPELRCEIIDGILYMSPAPLPWHQMIAKRIGWIFEAYAQQHGAVVLFSPIDVVLSPRQVLQPDIIYIGQTQLHIIGEKNITGAPNLVVEVLSTTTLKQDRGRKFEVYAEFGVQEYWIADPAAKALEIYTLANARYSLHAAEAGQGVVASALLTGLSCDVAQVFRAMV